MKILIAGEDQVLTGLIKHSLSGIAAQISIATSERAFHHACVTESYQAIVTTFVQPFLNGSDIMTNIRRDGAMPTIYLLSWMQNEQTVLSLYENGINQYFSLPVNIPRLVSKVKEQIER